MNKQRPSKSAANSANSTKLPRPPNDAPPPIQPVQSTTNPDSLQSPRRNVGTKERDASVDGHNGKFESHQQQRRKRSNEPIKRRESKEKLRKSATIEERDGGNQPKQIDGVEERLEELRRENNALKRKLEEQIRLNSVIVANPTKGLNWRIADTSMASSSSASTAAVANTIMGQELANFGSAFSTMEASEKIGRIKTISDSLPHTSAIGPTSSSSLLLPSMPSPNGIFQKSESSAFSVICRGQKEEEQLIGPPINPPMDLLNYYAPNFHLPSQLGDNFLAQSEFVRLATQLTPFSLFSMDAAASQPSSSGNNLMERHQQLISQLYGMPDHVATIDRLQSTDRMAELSRPLTLETSTVDVNCSSRREYFPMNEIDNGGQEGPLDFSNKTGGVIRSKGNANAIGIPFPQNQKSRPKSVITTNIVGQTQMNCELTMPHPLQPPAAQQLNEQLIESAPPNPNAIGGQTKVASSSSSSSISSPPLPIHFHNSAPNFCFHHSKPNFALCENHKRQSVLEIATNSAQFPPPPSLLPNLNGCLPPSGPSLFNNPFAKLFHRQQNIQKELEDSTSTENDHFGRMMDSKGKNTVRNSLSADERHQNCVERQNSPKRLGHKQKDGNSSGKNAVFVAGPSSSSSMSMLGTLLAAPNKRHTSPTVPASRTELCSGLASSVEVGTSQQAVDLIDESRRRIMVMERAEEEKKHQNGPQQGEKNGSSDSEHSSTGGCGPSNSPTNSMDSSHSASPHHQNSSGSSPSSSTLPGAGSTVTTICGSDRTRRGSSSPSGNSGCSGDDSLGDSFHNMRKDMIIANAENGKKCTTELGQNQNGRQSTGGHQKMRQSSGNGMNLRVKLRTSEELERYMDRRRRNNEAAKRCRANRRAVFEYRSRRAQMLEAENGELRQEMIKLNNELDQLKAIIATNSAAANRILPTA